MKTIEHVLQELGITYTRYEHPAVFTCQQADEHCAMIPENKSKNLFLRNEAGTQHYLVTVPAEKRIDLKALAQLLGERRFGFASPERLAKYLKLLPGAVSPFGIINDTQKHVIVVIDNELLTHDTVAFHPNINTATLVISTADFKKFLAASGNRILFHTLPVNN